MSNEFAPKWEYKSIKEIGSMKDTVLNSFGSQGWELVSVHEHEIQGGEGFHRHAAKLVYTFKRPIDSSLCPQT